jgi:hypothetical protein
VRAPARRPLGVRGRGVRCFALNDSVVPLIHRTTPQYRASRCSWSSCAVLGMSGSSPSRRSWSSAITRRWSVTSCRTRKSWDGEATEARETGQMSCSETETVTMLRVESRPLPLVSPEIELTSNAPTGCIDHPQELPAGMTSTVESTLNVLRWTAHGAPHRAWFGRGRFVAVRNGGACSRGPHRAVRARDRFPASIRRACASRLTPVSRHEARPSVQS